MTDVVSPRQFFHGSLNDITDAVKPGVEVGQQNYPYAEGVLRHGGYDPREYVHGADEVTAWEFAGHGGRRRVYKIAPPDEGKEDPNWEGARVWKHPVPVVDRIDIMHPDAYSTYGGGEVVGVQGTLPPINWNQYAPRNAGDANFQALRDTGGGPPQRTALEFEKSRRQQMEENLARLRQFRQIPGQQHFDLGDSGSASGINWPQRAIG